MKKWRTSAFDSHDVSVKTTRVVAGESLKGLGGRDGRPLGEGAEILCARGMFGNDDGRRVRCGPGGHDDLGCDRLAAVLRQSVAQASDEREESEREHSEGFPGRDDEASESGSGRIRLILGMVCRAVYVLLANECRFSSGGEGFQKEGRCVRVDAERLRW